MGFWPTLHASEREEWIKLYVHERKMRKLGYTYGSDRLIANARKHALNASASLRATATQGRT